MLGIIVAMIVLVGIVIIYLSLQTENDDNENIEVIKKDNEVFDELKDINIKNEKILNLKNEIHKYIVGTENLINAIIVSILANDHIIVEGVPGLAKTRTILVFSKLLGLEFKRIQFTPDMLPSDIIGGEIYNKNTSKFEVFKGPVFTNLLLADEINRATPKVQSALLEAMQEKQVTIGNTTFNLPKPFFVMATQNPLEQEGTFPLPEAQLDRFLFKIVVSYLDKEEEKQVLDSYNTNLDNLNSLLDANDIFKMQEEIEKVIVPDNVKNYIVDIVSATRENNDNIEVGASTRATIAFKKASKVLAYLQGKDKVEIIDVKRLILPILRHRVKPSYKINETNKTIDDVIFEQIIKVKDFN